MVLVRNISVQTTAALQFVDITEEVEREVEASGGEEGVVMLRSRRTTAARRGRGGDPSDHGEWLDGARAGGRRELAV